MTIQDAEFQSEVTTNFLPRRADMMHTCRSKSYVAQKAESKIYSAK